MKPRRISIKFFCRDGAAGDLPAAIGLFHRLIQEQVVEGLLVDVADYIHVPDGPGVILVGHEVEYSLDATEGRPGLLTTAKRIEDTPLADSVRTTLRRALVAATVIEADGSTGARFDTAAFELRVLDRLEAPHDDVSYAKAAEELAAVLSDVPGGEAFGLEPIPDADARQALAVSARADHALDAAAAIAALGGARLGGEAPAAASQGPFEISAKELARLRDAGADFDLIDVREPDEYAHGNLGGRLIPLGELPERIGELDKTRHVVVHCKVGGRGAQATQMLRDAGFGNAWNVRGGLASWVEEVDPGFELP